MTAADRPKATVLFPLYIYPLSEKTWQPLHDVISAHPNVDFLIVINPNSGPGEFDLPSHDYVREVPKLNKHANVHTVGYIRIDYCRKPLAESQTEIDRYAGWASDFSNSLLGVEGILIDESPNHHTPERAEYLDALYTYIKAKDGIMGNRLVVHNPGTPPDAALCTNGPDVVVTCEEPYARYKGAEVQQRLREYPYAHARTGFMISAVPPSEIENCARELRQRGQYIFATSLVDDFYESFGKCWHDFVAAFE